ncbi:MULTISPECIES: hypothetical protein [Methanobacterium]|uniref:hypothetical protein n=1 Tax=Methanobacterium TaxID=2160 RepID=UPI00159F0AD5|nr:MULTISPECIES: hypothetical protein [Methanobacterium]
MIKVSVATCLPVAAPFSSSKTGLVYILFHWDSANIDIISCRFLILYYPGNRGRILLYFSCIHYMQDNLAAFSSVEVQLYNYTF